MANEKSRFKSPEFLGGALGGLAGALKGIFVDQPAYESAVASRAIEARFAPLQGRASPSFSDIRKPDTMQSALDFGLTGIATGRKISEARKGEALFNKLEAEKKARFDKLLELYEKSKASQKHQAMQSTAESFGVYGPMSAEFLGQQTPASLRDIAARQAFTSAMQKPDYLNPMGVTAADFENYLQRMRTLPSFAGGD